MKILNIRAFDGRSIYAHKKCIKVELDLEGYSDIASNEIEDFNYSLLKMLPELKKHRCGIAVDGGFERRLEEGTYLSHICEHTIIALQNILGIEVSYGKAREIQGERYYIIYEYKYKETALSAAKMAVDIINALVYKKQFDFTGRYKALKETMNSEFVGPSTQAIIDEAQKAGIPIVNIVDTGLYQLGLGKYGKFIEATICEDTCAIGVDISCDKMMTKAILDIQCLPIAKGFKIRNLIDLATLAKTIGYPIVLKPEFGNQGKGVYVNLKNEKEAIQAYIKVHKEFKEIIMEKFIEGNDYRVCVIDGEVVAVAQRIPPFVLGDGKRTLKELIDEVNRDPNRGVGHEKPLTRINIDAKLLTEVSKNGYSLNCIPALGIKVFLRGNANLSTGGIALDCTDDICDENIEICIRTAKAVGLNICGIDICSKSINIPLTKQGAIIEVNAAPGIRMHHFPYQGRSRNVAGAIINMMFKKTPKTIPIVAITGTNGKTTTTRLIGHVLSLANYNVGMTTTGGIYINNNCIDARDNTGPESAMAVMINREIDIAVLETARGGIIRGGLAYDLADVGVITNITDDHLGLDGVESLEDLANVKSLVVEAVKDNGYSIINVDDKMSRSIIHRIKSNIIMFSKDKNNELLRQNLIKGGIGVYTKDGYICVEQNANIYKIAAIDDICITLGGKLIYNIENSMAACAALIGLGINYFTISKGLTSFYCDEEHNPGRFNMYNVNGATVILDYGHNIEGYKAVLKGVTQLKYSRLIGIIGVPGDRLDSNIIDVGKISADYFDYIYIKEDEDKRGRRKGEVANLLMKGLIIDDFDESCVEVIFSEQEALYKALDCARYGDLIIVFFEKYEPLLDIIKNKTGISQGKVAMSYI